MTVWRLPSWLGRLLGASIELGPVEVLAEDDPRTDAHEAQHAREQAVMGWASWDWRWLVHRSNRLQDEARAWAAEGDRNGLEAFARALTSWRYLWVARSVEEARRALQSAWDAQHPVVP